MKTYIGKLIFAVSMIVYFTSPLWMLLLLGVCRGRDYGWLMSIFITIGATVVVIFGTGCLMKLGNALRYAVAKDQDSGQAFMTR